MGGMTVGSRPRKYALLEGMEENPSIEAGPSMAKMRLTFQVEMRRGMDSAKQKKLAELIGDALELGLQQILNLYNIVLARSEQITQALALPEEVRVVVDLDHVAFSVMLDAFSLESVETCIYLLHQACGQVAQGVGR